MIPWTCSQHDYNTVNWLEQNITCIYPDTVSAVNAHTKSATWKIYWHKHTCRLYSSCNSLLNKVLHFSKYNEGIRIKNNYEYLITWEPVISTLWTLLIVSIKLCASSMMTTLPSSFIPQASLVDLWRRMLYGKTTSWFRIKLKNNLCIYFLILLLISSKRYCQL